jgi:hypothetical protein
MVKKAGRINPGDLVKPWHNRFPDGWAEMLYNKNRGVWSMHNRFLFSLGRRYTAMCIAVPNRFGSYSGVDQATSQGALLLWLLESERPTIFWSWSNDFDVVSHG